MKKPIRVSFARMPEEVAKLSPEDKTRAAVKMGLRLGDDPVLQVFPSREFMARMVRKEERGAPELTVWRPVVKLSDGEGY